MKHILILFTVIFGFGTAQAQLVGEPQAGLMKKAVAQELRKGYLTCTSSIGAPNDYSLASQSAYIEGTRTVTQDPSQQKIVFNYLAESLAFTVTVITSANFKSILYSEMKVEEISYQEVNVGTLTNPVFIRKEIRSVREESVCKV